MKRYLIYGSLAILGVFVFVACSNHAPGADVVWYHDMGHWFTDFFGGNTPDGQSSPAERLFAWGDLLVPGLGTLSVGLAKMARDAIKAKNAIYESTDDAIKSGELGSAETEEAIKVVLNKYQTLHNDSELVKKDFKRFRDGGGFKKAKETIVGLPKLALDTLKGIIGK